MKSNQKDKTDQKEYVDDVCSSKCEICGLQAWNVRGGKLHSVNDYKNICEECLGSLGLNSR